MTTHDSSDRELREDILKLFLGKHYGKVPLSTIEPEMTQIMQLIKADREAAVLEAQVSELERFSTHRHYGRDYHETLDALGDYKYARLAELRIKLQALKQKK